MKYFKDKDGRTKALPEIKDPDLAGLTEITKEEYIYLLPVVEEADEAGTVGAEVNLPVELKFINDQGGITKAIYAMAVAAGMVDGVREVSVQLTPTDKIAVDNFYDIKDVPFSLKLRNATGEELNGVTAVIEDVPYNVIENLKYDDELTYTVSKGESGYTHTFELLEALAAYSSVSIDGDKLDMFGIGDADGNPKLFTR